MSVMRTARLEYASGREVLRDYWGYLSYGGLSLGERGDAIAGNFADGDSILLNIRIASLRKEYRLAARVRRRGDGRPVVAFEAGQPRDLLDAAWADGQGVPERRHRRWDVSGEVRYRVADREGPGRLVNVSRGGCCMSVEAPLRANLRIVVAIDGAAGASLAPLAPAAQIEGRVRWTAGRSRLAGIEFERFQEDLVKRLISSSVAAMPITP